MTQRQPQKGLCASALAACFCALLTLLLALPHTAHAEGAITQLDPSSVNQGDTLLVTIRGTDLPTGSVVVEFFPQQIAVLSLLSATDSEIMVQIKVPPLAPSGKYNVIIYNQLGDEVTGDGLFTVLSDLVTPVFRDYDPKVIAQASSAFALVLSGELVSRDAVNHLSMQWTQGNKPVEGMETSFAYASPTAVSVAVTGKLPGGKLDGRVLLDSKPIYFLSVELPGEKPEIYGHSPSRQAVSSEPLTFKLVGASFSRSLMPRLSARLVSIPPSKKTKPQTYNATLSFVDEAALSLQFSGAPEGKYTLQLLLDGSPAYSGSVELLPADAVVPDEPAITPGPPDSPLDSVPQDLPPVDPPILVEPLTGPDYGLPDDSPADVAMPLPLMDVQPAVIRPGETARFSLQLDTLESYVLDRLQLSLEGEGWSEAPVMQGTRDGNLVAVFELPQRDWQPDDSIRLRVVDPLKLYAPHNQSIALELPAGEAPVETLPPDEPPAVHVTGDTSTAPDIASSGFRPSHADQPPTPEGAASPAAEPEFIPDEPSDNPQSESSDPSSDTSSDASESAADSSGEAAAANAGAVEVATALPPADNDSTATQAEPDGDPEAPADSTEAPAVTGDTYLLEEQVLLGETGFTLLLASAASASAAQWSAAVLSSDDALLAANAERFDISARVARRGGQQNIELSFTPRAGAFEPLAWSLLLDSLCSGEKVALSLSWPEAASGLPEKLDLKVVFSRTSD